MRWQLRIVLTFVPVLESGCLRPNHYTTVKAILLKNCQNVTKIKTVVMFTSVVQVSSVCMCFQTIKQFETLFLIEYIFLITSFVLLFLLSFCMNGELLNTRYYNNNEILSPNCQVQIIKWFLISSTLSVFPLDGGIFCSYVHWNVLILIEKHETISLHRAFYGTKYWICWK